MPRQAERATDRRVARTQKALRSALHALVREKNYDDIAVKEILDRADVGRSAFYAHFRDKDDLLASAIRDMIEPTQPSRRKSGDCLADRLPGFSLPIFEHHDGHRWTAPLRMSPRARAILHEYLRKVVRGWIAPQMKKSYRGQNGDLPAVPGELWVEYVASTLILVLEWWLETRSPLSAHEVNQLLHSLLRPTLTAWGV